MIRYYLSRAYDIYMTQGISELFNRTKSRVTRMFSIEQQIRIARLKYRLKGYKAVDDPLRVFWTPVSDLNHIIKEQELDIPVPEFGIINDNWDKKITPVKEHELMRMFKQHFEEGIPWEETDEFLEIVEQFEAGKPIQHLDLPPNQQSISYYRDYLNYMDELYHTIQQDGYKSQSELGPSDYIDRSNYSSVPEVYVPHPALNEIQIMIGQIFVKSSERTSRFINE